MKSAFEKALEKADKIGKLSPEEMREREEAEYTPVGRAIAERFLGHGHKQILKEEVERYSSDENGVVVRAALSRLVEAIALSGGDPIERSLDGLLTLKGKEGIGEKIDSIRILFAEFQEEREQEYEREKENIEKSERELLHQLRITGSAVGAINPNASESLSLVYEQLNSRFNESLEALKQELQILLNGS
ncbi:MAG: hypothetical protein RI591_07235 [Dehalococcoidia bacterium]|nr:hypothetical protein [Dehalococcoidia bacterium]